MNRALITGIGGQDGSYLTELLLSKNYDVHGIIRREPASIKNLEKVWNRITVHYGDMRDGMSIESAVRKAEPDEIYNLAGQVFVPASWTRGDETFDVNVAGLARIMRAVENVKRPIRVYQASSSEMYGNTLAKNDKNVYLNELSPMKPVSPYGVSKYAAHHLARVYRERGHFVTCGILFNHESERRGEEMVTRKITRTVAKWAVGQVISLRLGNVMSRRDWGYAPDYVDAMWRMLQQDEAQDWVVGTGQSHTVLDFLQTAVRKAGFDWVDICDKIFFDDPAMTRADELAALCADFAKAQQWLEWAPTVKFEELVGKMVEYDMQRLLPQNLVTV